MTLARQIGHDRRDSIIEEAPGGGDEFKVLAVRRNRLSCNAIKKGVGPSRRPPMLDNEIPALSYSSLLPDLRWTSRRKL